MAIVQIKNIEKKYKKRKKEMVILKDINYSFETGKLYTISGRSGSGKTTLINLLGLIIKPTKGDIIIDGKTTNNLSDSLLSKLRNKEIGFVFQSFYLNPLLTAEENILLALYINHKNKKEAKNIALKLLKLVDLENRGNHYPKELSGGEQQRVAIARALANEPKIVLADEPTGSLDPQNEENIMKLLKNISQKGKCVIVVTHSNTVKQYADIRLKINNKGLEVEQNEK